MRIHTKYFFLFILAGIVFLSVRRWTDRKREKIQDIDIVRQDIDEGDAQLGLWAQKNDSALLSLRLKRDGSFDYQVVAYPVKDTLRYTGSYQIVSSVVSNSRLTYPRLIAVSAHGDTVINHFIQLTRATRKDVDVLSLKTSNEPDAPAMLFYRIKQ
jgi:hypothetical protein